MPLDWARCVCVVLIGLFLLPMSAAAQKESLRSKCYRTVGGYTLPEGIVAEPPSEEVVLWSPEDGEPEVVRVLREVAHNRLVETRRGKVRYALRRETESTDQPFKPITADELIAELRDDLQPFVAPGREFHFDREGYYLFAYDSSAAFCEHAKGILTSMLPGVIKTFKEWGLDPKRPERPMVVVILSDRDAYEAISSPPDSVAVTYDGDNRRILWYEDPSFHDEASELELRNASYVFAHAAIHQLMECTGVEPHRAGWPVWLDDGIAEYFAPLDVETTIRRVDGNEVPMRNVTWSTPGALNTLRMHTLLQTNADGGKLIERTLTSQELRLDEYPIAWGLTHYLSEKRPEEFRMYLADVAAKQPLDGAAGKQGHAADPLFVKHFGDDFAAIEKELQKHLTSPRMRKRYLDPIVNQRHYVLSMTVKEGRTMHTLYGVAMSPIEAEKWRAEQLEKIADKGQTGVVRVRECDTRNEAQYYLDRITRR